MPVNKMTFVEASKITLPFKKYRGQEIGKVGGSDEGLLYLDWVRGNVKLYGSIADALAVYLGDSLIDIEVGHAMDRKAKTRKAAGKGAYKRRGGW